jgi:hypothetical protein
MPAKVVRRSSGTISFDSNVNFVNDLLAVSTTDLTTTDPIITVNDQAGTVPGAGSGLEVSAGNVAVASLLYTSSAGNGNWAFVGEGSMTVDFQNATFNNFSIGTVASINVTSNLASPGANITGGYIDSTAIGSTTPSTGSFTDLTATGTVSLGAHSGTLTGDTTGLHTGNVLAANTDVILNVGSSPAMLTGQVSSIANHDTDNLGEGTTNLYYTDTRWDNRLATKTTDNVIEGASNLYYTNSRADARINAANLTDLNNVTIASVNSGEVLTWSGTAWINQAQAQNVVNSSVDDDNSTTAISGATLEAEAASGLSVALNPSSNSNNILVTAHVKYQVQSSTGTTAFYIRLYRNKGGPGETLLAEDTVYESANTPTIYQSNFNVYDIPGGSATYSVYYDASTANGTLTPNPQHSDTTASKGYITATEVRIATLNIVEDTTPSLGGTLDVNSQNIQFPTTTINDVIDDDTFATANATKLATAESIKAYVDSQVATANELSELTDVSIGTPSNGDVLKYNTSTSRWEAGVDVDTDTGILSIVEDTTPQLGGDLDLNSQNITGTGNINTTGNAEFSGNLTVQGNLTVNGSTTTIDVTQLEVDDPMIYLNRNADTGSTNAFDSGLLIERGSTEDHAGMIWQESTDRFKFLTSSSVTSTTTVVTNITLADVEAATAHVTATSAQYADLAELYTSDAEYPRGTVMVFGGDAEVTQSIQAMDHKIAGVVSEEPAYLMNSGEEGLTVAVALRGKVPVMIKGPVKKGDLIVSSNEPGVGEAHDGVTNCVYVIGKCIENDDTENLTRLIYCVI